eukprot:5581403-Pyramimonas_sp.AAC.2
MWDEGQGMGGRAKREGGGGPSMQSPHALPAPGLRWGAIQLGGFVPDPIPAPASCTEVHVARRPVKL